MADLAKDGRYWVREEILESVIKEFLKDLPTDWQKDGTCPSDLRNQLLSKQCMKINMINQNLPKGYPKIKIPTQLDIEDTVALLLHIYHVCRISTGDAKYDDDALLAIYQESGPLMGTYSCSESDFLSAIRSISSRYRKKDFEECMYLIRQIAPVLDPCKDKNLIPVNNGIYDMSQDALLPFSPDIIFTTKCPIDYVDQPQSPQIPCSDGSVWEIEEWMKCLSSDNSIVNLLWQGLAASIRPNGCWNKSLWLYSEKGNNGKGTYCELMRALCGGRNWTSAPISVFSKEFGLEGLVGVNTIITDENSVESYGEKLESMKAVITGDVVVINRKFKAQVAQRFTGFMLQCVNSLPRTRDKSGSWYRRLIFVPMTACFTGTENTEIKSDYVKRRDVLEYVLYRVLHMKFDKLSEPEPCKNLLEQYKVYNDTIREWWEDTREDYKWSLLPFNFLFDCYTAWCTKYAPGTSNLKKRITFIQEFAEIIDEDEDWEYAESSGSEKNRFAKIWTGDKMDAYEPMILEYDLKNWMNVNYKGGDPQKKADFDRKQNYRGIRKKN